MIHISANDKCQENINYSSQYLNSIKIVKPFQLKYKAHNPNQHVTMRINIAGFTITKKDRNDKKYCKERAVKWKKPQPFS